MEEKKRINQILIDLPIAFKKLHCNDGKARYTEEKAISENNLYFKRLEADFKQIYKETSERVGARIFLKLLLGKDGYTPSPNTLNSIEKYIDGIHKGIIYIENDECVYDPTRIGVSKKEKQWEIAAYIVGLFLFFIPWISLPIASIGLYKTVKENYNSKRRKIRYWLFGLIAFLSLVVGITLNALFAFKMSKEMNRLDSLDHQSLHPTLQRRFLNIHNYSTAKTKYYSYNKYEEQAKLGDTLTLAIVLYNEGFIKIPNVRVKLFNKRFPVSNRNTIMASIGSDKSREIQSTVSVNIPKQCYLEVTNHASWAINNDINNKIPLGKEDFSKLFNNGFNIPYLEPDRKNLQVVYVDYVVKKTSYED